MRRFVLFFLLCGALGAALSLPAFAAVDQKELSEEEEIALMMEQLEQFKTSWENKEQAEKTAVPDAPKPLLAEKRSVLSNRSDVVPAAGGTPQVIRSFKSTAAQVRAITKPAPINIEDGQPLGRSGRNDEKPEIKTQSKPAVIAKPEVLVAPPKNTAEKEIASGQAETVPPRPARAIPASEAKATLARQQKKSEEQIPQADAKAANQELLRKLNIPVMPKTAVPDKVLEKAVNPAATPTSEIKAAPVTPENKGAVKDSKEKLEIANKELVKELHVPAKPEITALPEALKKSAESVVRPKSDGGSRRGIEEDELEKQVVAGNDKLIKQALIKKPTVPVKPEIEILEESLEKAGAAQARQTKSAFAEIVPSSGVEQSVKPNLTHETPEASPDEIVIVQDEAAQYRAAREKADLKSASAARVIESDDDKALGRRQGVSLPGDARAQTRSKWAAARKGGPIKKEPPKPNLFADTFFLSAEQRLAYDVYDIDGFIFVKSPNPDLNTKYAVVTGFGGGAMKTRSIPNLQTLEEAKKWVSDNLKTEKFESVEIKKMSLGKEGSAKDLYWVGQKAYPDYKTAQQEVAVLQSIVTAQGGDFVQLVSEASSYAPMTDGTQGMEIKGPANFEREEELMLKYLDQLDVGEKLFGPFQGDSSGESFSWQSFGETTWRKTNLDRTDYRSQVGYWTNRVVFKGFRFPMNTVDAFLEDTLSLDSTSADFSSNMTLFAGLEWRPFARNAWLYNYRPWGGISVLEWVKNFRFYMMYGERKPIKDPIEGSADTDLLAGVQIFYEWGVELPPLDQRDPKTFSDFVEQYFWGEYFGNYRHEMTNFGPEDDYNSWLGGSSVTMGVKLPGIPLPANPINEELMLMPYMRFEHVNSAEFSFPYQNQYFVAAGMRWMPWRNYRYKENEWLSKAKFFGEFVGVGLTQHAKQDDEAPNAVRYDLRFGVSFSSRRY